jgi:hypothetical protein
MGRKRIKFIAKRAWDFTKWVVGWPLAILGLSGIPDSIDAWSKIFDGLLQLVGRVMTDQRVQQLAEKAVEFANFVNKTPIRVMLVPVGVSILIWGWRPFWSLRHRVLFRLWRLILNEQKWISREDAISSLRHPIGHGLRSRKPLSVRALV